MKTKFYVIALFIAITFTACKKEEEKFNDYRYTDKGMVLNCEGLDTQLYNEALFAFENDMIKFYANGNPNITRAYSNFVRNSVIGRVDYSKMLSPHTVQVFEYLKNDGDLWNLNNSKSKLNYNSDLFNCIANSIDSDELKTTLNALLSTNSMSTKLFGPPLISNYSRAIKDKYLSAYIAFDLYYAKLFDVDLTQVNMEEVEDVDFNNVTIPEPIDPHAGHNH